MTFICDRCEKKLLPAVQTERGHLVPKKCRKFYDSEGVPEYAFCDECWESFSDWFEEGRP